MDQPKTLKQKIKTRVARTKKTDVFLPRDFADLTGEDQVLPALRSLVCGGVLLRLGYGVYARATRSRISGRLMVSIANGFQSAVLQALNKLGVPSQQSDSTKAYNEADHPDPDESDGQSQDALQPAAIRWSHGASR